LAAANKPLLLLLLQAASQLAFTLPSSFDHNPLLLLLLL